jgi:limonene-1,2-epoxide hydrolase
MTADETVRAMIAALERKDVAAAVEMMTDDVEYDNVPMGKVHGRDGVSASLQPFLNGCSRIEWIIHHQAATGDVVMNERTDRFEIKGRWAEAHCAGLFVLRGGKIALWRDYFDLPTVQAELAG